MPYRACCICSLILFVVVPTAAWSQTSPRELAKLSIEQLLEVELTSTASKFEQEVTRAPASVSVITADEIRLRGYRSFAEILGSVRGIYTSYDRNYSYVGVRGFARPGDYNTRVLLLVDGHRLNEPIYDMAPVGMDFPIHISWIERVEVIRGPASSLYGTSAFFAVINVITKTAATHGGVRVHAAAGSLGTSVGTASVGRVFEGGSEVLLGVSGYNSSGNARLFFPEFAGDPATNGVALDADGEQSASTFLSASIGRFQIRGGFIDREKHVPTASFGTVFGDRRLRTDDRRAFADVAYSGTLGKGWTGVARGAFDYNSYAGEYPYDYGADEPMLQHDGSDSGVASAELTLNRRWQRLLFTGGSEFRHHLHTHQWVEDPNGRLLDDEHRASILGLYVQGEFTVRKWMLVNAGTRFDYHSAFGGRATPRVGLVLLPRPQSALKVLYGQAYRAPNSYELHYFDTMRDRTLEPETIATTEIVWEEYIGAHLRTGLSLFHYDADQLVEQRSLPIELTSSAAEDTLYFANAGRSTAYGIEAEVEGRWRSGIAARASYANVQAVDAAEGALLSNSPRNLGALGLTVPVRPLPTTIALDTRFVGGRRALTGNLVNGFLLANLVSTTAIGKRLELGLGVYNLFNRTYADPGAEEHVQSSIPQDGRTLRVQLSAKF